MVTSFKTGSFTSITTTGTQSITGVGFQPKVIILYATVGTTADDTFTGNWELRIGWAVDTTAANQKSCDVYSKTASATQFTERGYSAAAVYCSELSGSSLNCIGPISAIGADGFTVNWTSTDALAKIINYICIGGADITNTKSGSFTTPSAGVTGNQATTGVGFQADVLLLFSADLADNAAAFNTPWGFGMATGSTNQVCCCGVAKEAAATMDNKRYQRGDNTNCFALVDYGTTTNKMLEGSLVSIDSDGFTINWTTVATNAASKSIAYLAIKGGSFKCGTTTAPTAGTSPVSQATTGVGFQPVGLVTASVGNTSSTAINSNNRVTIAAGSSSTSARLAWAGDTNGVADSISAKIHRNNKIASTITEAATATSSTINASASITSLDTDGFTLSWDTHDTNAYEVLYLAVGSNAATGKSFYVSEAFFRADG